ncbi:MAG: GNAT family N-acetyltransferase [Actinobacteria bacterium]|nr:GNAT family N-acetyltransferase [Actinomycetota bacterium]
MAQLDDAAAYWPLFQLSVRTPRIELRYPDEAAFMGLTALARKGVHDPASMPFSIAWTDQESPAFEREALKHYWGSRANLSANSWNLPMAVFVDDELAGVQDANAQDFAKLRVAGTGSWLGLEFHGRGIGKEMRAAILHLLFEGLGAVRCVSGAWHDNGPSHGVSRSLGYAENGEDLMLRRGEPDRLIRLLLTRAEWEKRRRDDIEIVGLDGCIDMLIASEDKAAS